MGVLCDICQQPLDPVFPDMARRSDDDQFVGCLHVIVEGGYGEYVEIARRRIDQATAQLQMAVSV